jgi:hypothetical protein
MRHQRPVWVGTAWLAGSVAVLVHWGGVLLSFVSFVWDARAEIRAALYL